MNEEAVNLTTLGRGAAVELFQEELTKVLRNIEDPNTKPTERRRITITVDFSPNDERQVTDTTIQCVSKLAPVKRVKTLLYLGRQGGAPVAVEHDPKQLTLNAPLAPVVPIASGAREEKA